MNSDLPHVNQWLLANKLSLNVVKTEFILIGSAKKLSIVLLHSQRIFSDDILGTEAIMALGIRMGRA